MMDFRGCAKALLGWSIVLLGLLCGAMAQPMETVPLTSPSQSLTNRLRAPVHPRRNVEDFQSVPARFIRFRVFRTNLSEPCLDELEVFSADEPEKNVALASAGAKATASGALLPGYQIHQVAGVNDGQYGNGHSWIADRVSNAWIQIELPRVVSINRIVWSRDRESFFVDRLATDYRIEASIDGEAWQLIASSADRVPPAAGDLAVRWSPIMNPMNRFGAAGVAAGPETAGRSCDYRIDRWQTENGLPDNTVTAILQTRDGYLWVGTLGGLVRFDGFKFKRYGAVAGLLNERVLCLYEDDAGRLWVGTDGGGLFCLENDQFRAIISHDGMSSDVVLAISEDQRHQFWIGTYAGLDCWKDGRFLHEQSLPLRPQVSAEVPAVVPAPPRISEPWRQPPTNPAPVSRIAFDSGGGLWSVVDSRLFQVGQGRYVMPWIEGEPSGQNVIAALRFGPSGRLWFGGISGYVAAFSNGVVTVISQPASLSPDMIVDICETRDGDLWMGTASSGLRRWRNGQVLSLTTEEGLADNSVQCVLEDREGNLWIGTSHGGLNRLKPKKLRLVARRDGLSHNVVMSMAEGVDGRVWIGSNGGGLSVQEGGGFAPANLRYMLDNESISSLLAAHNGTLWIGTRSSGLIRKVGEHNDQFSIARKWEDESVLALCEDREGSLWVGTYQDGLKCFRDDKFTSYRTTNGLSANYITTLAQDGKGRLWIGTGGSGLNCYVDGFFRVWTCKDDLASDFIRTLYVDTDDVLWIGTSGGLSRCKDGRFSALSKQQGLWDDVISQILEDDSGHLWFGSNRGIFRVRKDELNAVAERRLSAVDSLVFGKEEGMENLECTGGFCPAGLKTRDGRLWFSTVKGVAVVDPKNIPVNKVAPPVVLEELLVNGKTIANGNGIAQNSVAKDSGSSNPALHPLRIGPGARRVEFHYTALSFTSPEKVRFRYRLDGLDSDWVEANENRTAEYPHLPAGQYLFRVTACNEDGVWSESGASLALICLPAFWQTPWCRLLMTLMVLSGAGWAVKILATRKLRQRLAVLEHQHALEKERTRIARDIHDELGSLLTGIALVSDHGEKHCDQPGKAERDFHQISETVLDAVQTVDGIVWAVNPRNDSLDSLANYLVHFAENFFRLTPSRCRLDVPALVPHIRVSTHQRHHLLMAVKEAFTNAARHSGATEVWLRLVVKELEISVTVEDNGRGFDPAISRVNQDGLPNMRQRMVDSGGQMELNSSPGHGTRVTFSVPLNHN